MREKTGVSRCIGGDFEGAGGWGGWGVGKVILRGFRMQVEEETERNFRVPSHGGGPSWDVLYAAPSSLSVNIIGLLVKLM